MSHRKQQLEEPLLSDQNDLIPISERKKGSKFSARLILVVEFFERICYYSTLGNLLIYCIAFVGLSKINSLLIVLISIGSSYFLTLTGCWISDSVSGKYKMILASILCYVFGSGGLLMLSYIVKKNVLNKMILLTISLACIAIGAAGIRSNISVFVARHAVPFGEQNVQSIFNWFYWLMNIAALISYTVIIYFQLQNFFDGYIPATSGVLFAALILLLKRRWFIDKPAEISFLTEISQITWHAFKRRVKFGSSIKKELPSKTNLDLLEYAHLMYGGSYSTDQLENVRCFGRMVLIFSLMTMYWVIYFQMPSIFFLQSHYFDLKVYSFQIPAASMYLVNTIAVIIMVQFMENCIYPFCQYFNLNFTPLRRIGFGLFLATLSMVYSGLLEQHRRQNVKISEKINIIFNTKFNCSSYTVFWQAPQFALIGFSEFFTSISGLELAYSQSPKHLHNIMMALFSSISGLGAFLAAIIIKILSLYTNWICEDINNCNLEYYFYLLSGLSVFLLLLYVMIACNFPYSASPYNHNISGEVSRSALSRTDISDISDFADNYFEGSSRIDLSREPSFDDDSS